MARDPRRLINKNPEKEKKTEKLTDIQINLYEASLNQDLPESPKEEQRENLRDHPEEGEEVQKKNRLGPR